MKIIFLHLKNRQYALGLVEILTFNSIPNLDNKKFYVSNIEPIKIPTGSYEIEDIEKILDDNLKRENINFTLKDNNNTLKSVIEWNKDIDFTKTDSIGDSLGFNKVKLLANQLHISTLPISIIKINSLRIECNIISGAYSNGREVHTLHQFLQDLKS